ncbi:MAG: hypothetical protein J0L92_29700 [Deltaproteobacteria bacterium]|nr:hypothetical protein [Deltaproteobacteria bacterium]
MKKGHALTSGLTVGSLRGVPVGTGRAPLATTRAAPPSMVALPPARRRNCCGTGCVGCPYGDFIRRTRLLRAGTPPLTE